jgi:hypothetical protein
MRAALVVPPCRLREAYHHRGGGAFRCLFFPVYVWEGNPRGPPPSARISGVGMELFPGGRNTSQKGSLLIFPDINVTPGAEGAPDFATIMRIANDGNQAIEA